MPTRALPPINLLCCPFYGSNVEANHDLGSNYYACLVSTLIVWSSPQIGWQLTLGWSHQSVAKKTCKGCKGVLESLPQINSERLVAEPLIPKIETNWNHLEKSCCSDSENGKQKKKSSKTLRRPVDWTIVHPLQSSFEDRRPHRILCKTTRNWVVLGAFNSSPISIPLHLSGPLLSGFLSHNTQVTKSALSRTPLRGCNTGIR